MHSNTPIPMKLHIYSIDKIGSPLVIVSERVPSFYDFLSMSKVKHGSYAFNFIHRLYDNLFLNAIDLRREYDSYYANEYINLCDFLYNKYSIGEEFIDTIRSEYTENCSVLMKFGTFGRDWSMHEILSYFRESFDILKSIYNINGDTRENTLGLRDE